MRRLPHPATPTPRGSFLVPMHSAHPRHPAANRTHPQSCTRCILAWLAALAAAIAGIPGCSRSPEEPASAGELRIVALSPAVAIILRDLGLEHFIVGRHARDMVLDAKLLACGDQTGIDYEVLLSVRPTVVITQWGARPPPERLVMMARREGWELIDLSMLAFDEVVAATRMLAQRFAPERVDLAAELAAFPSAREVYANLGPVLLLVGLESPGVLGPGSFHYDLMLRLGANPAPDTGSAFMTLDAEDILALAPEAIMVFAPRSDGSREGIVLGNEALARLGMLGRLPIPAVQNGRVAILEDSLGLMPSTALILVRSTMVQVLDRWCIEPEAHGR